MERRAIVLRRSGWVLAAALLMSVSACGGSSDGDPVAEPASSYVEPAAGEPWDPCTIPDSAVEAAGLDVATGVPNLVGSAPISPDWKTCIWRDPLPQSWYFLGIFSGISSLENLQENRRFDRFTVVEDLGAVRFLRADREPGRSCGVAFEVEDGLVYFILDTGADLDPLRDPCDELDEVARALLPAMPPLTN